MHASDTTVSGGPGGPFDDTEAEVSITVDVPCYLVCFYDTVVMNDTLGAFVSILLNINGSDTAVYMGVRIDSTPSGYASNSYCWVQEVTAGTHTIKGRFYTNTGTASVLRRTLGVLAIPK